MAFLSKVFFDGDGAKIGPFTLTFPYISEAHVQVFVDGALKVLGTDYEFTTATTVGFLTGAPPVARSYLVPVSNAGFKKPGTLIHNLIDNVSKNGYLLLNVGPKADGSMMVRWRRFSCWEVMRKKMGAD